MALKDNDYLETNVSMRTVLGGNGDYYIELWFKDGNGLNQNKFIRVSTSGGSAPSKVKIAVANLFRAMEEEKLNEIPD